MEVIAEALGLDLTDSRTVTTLENHRRMRILGEVLRKRREALGLKREELAEALGVTTLQVAQAELEGVGGLKVSTVSRLAEHLGLRLELALTEE